MPPAETWEPEPYTQLLPKLFEFLRAELGDSVQLIHDVHERVTPSQGLRLACDLAPFNLFYLEDLLRPEHLDTFRLVRSQSPVPLAMGEVFCNPWEGQELWFEHLVDYARHDLAHVGGITAARKIAAVCEARGILTAWHGPGNISPVTHMANAHVSLAVPNFGIQEFDADWDERIEEVFSTAPAYADEPLTVVLETRGRPVDGIVHLTTDVLKEDDSRCLQGTCRLKLDQEISNSPQDKLGTPPPPPSARYPPVSDHQSSPF